METDGRLSPDRRTLAPDSARTPPPGLLVVVMNAVIPDSDLLPIGGDRDYGDLGGWAYSWLFSIAEVLSAASESVPAEWGFCPVPALESAHSLDEYARATDDDPQVSAVIDAYHTHGVHSIRAIGSTLYEFIRNWKY
ncbi:hypothetical protein [Nocardia aurea]|uniref:Uncharacterized protein n=1 Tax=Nocardia aurea TaxID=2144174 RepID=A0ABV3FXQ8_9NOCA